MPCCLPGWQLTVLFTGLSSGARSPDCFPEPCQAPIHLFAIWLNLMKMLQPAIYKTNANKTWDCLLASPGPAPWATTTSLGLQKLRGCYWDAGSVLSTHRECCHLFPGWRSQTNECKRFLTASSSLRSKNVLKWQKAMFTEGGLGLEFFAPLWWLHPGCIVVS